MVLLECAKSIVIISNVFYTTGLLYLAQKSSVEQCEDHERRGLDLNTSGVSITCVNDGKILGFDPVSLVTNMWTISGVLGALFLPYIGKCCIAHTRVISNLQRMKAEPAELSITVLCTFSNLCFAYSVAGRIYT